MEIRLLNEEEREWRYARARIRRAEQTRKVDGKNGDDSESQKRRRLKRKADSDLEENELIRKWQKKRRSGFVRIGEDGYWTAVIRVLNVNAVGRCVS